MKAWARRNKGKIGAALTLAAAGAATYYGGPMAGDAAKEYAPVILRALGSLFGL